MGSRSAPVTLATATKIADGVFGKSLVQLTDRNPLQRSLRGWRPYVKFTSLLTPFAIEGLNSTSRSSGSTVVRVFTKQLGSSRQFSCHTRNRQSDLLGLLEKRGFVNQIVGERQDLDVLLQHQNVSAYAGIDPTAPSLHLGHLLPLMALYWIQSTGHHVYGVVGGFTATVGDPTGRTTARASLSNHDVGRNSAGIRNQLVTIAERARALLQAKGLQHSALYHSIHTVSNSEWQEHLSFADFARHMAGNTRLGPLLGRDTVKNRIQHGDGMSVLEFLYPLIQAWDWWHLYSLKMSQIQVGGADQFGNILSGAEAINSIVKHTKFGNEDTPRPLKGETPHPRPLGFTIPLLTTASGEKFGKSAGNAIWLDSKLTSPFDLYQFFVGSADANVHQYLKLFTFDPLESLEELMLQHNRDHSKRLAQKHLASQVLDLVHGQEVSTATREIHNLLFQPRSILDAHTICELVIQSNSTLGTPVNGQEATKEPTGEKKSTEPASASPSSIIATLSKSLVYGQALHKTFYHAGLVESKMEAQRLCSGGGAYVGLKSQAGLGQRTTVSFTQVQEWNPAEIDEKYLIGGNLLLLRAGKQKVKIVKLQE